MTKASLTSEGAAWLPSEDCADIARHRNEIATAALGILDSEAGKGFAWILWLDGDIEASSVSVLRLIDIWEELRSHHHPVSLLLGNYPIRNRPEVSAARPTGPAFRLPSGKAVVPAEGGLGFALQSVGSFRSQVESAPLVHSGGGTFHAVCQTQAVGIDGLLHWESEDFYYCRRSLCTYLSLDTEVGHECRVILYPQRAEEE
jgi:hypothetical protein